MTVCYTAFYFGPSFPSLFLIALASLVCLYVVERLAMAYGYQKPPMYDDEANTKVVRMLAFAPIMYAGNAIWIFSNQQVFQASAVAVDSIKLFPISGHTW